MRSEIAPQSWRQMKPVPSTSDSMAAPRVAEMPRSEQSATRCACGIDMVTQQRNEANASSANTTFGGQPNTFGARLLIGGAAGEMRHFRRRPQRE